MSCQKCGEDRRCLIDKSLKLSEGKGYADHLFKASLRGNLESVSRSEDIQLECVHSEGERHTQRMEEFVSNVCHGGFLAWFKAETKQIFM